MPLKFKDPRMRTRPNSVPLSRWRTRPEVRCCPAIEGLRAEGLYENLILNAEEMDHNDVAEILGRNIGEEQHTLEEVLSLQKEVAATTPKASA
jgi:hypothetical protein